MEKTGIIALEKTDKNCVKKLRTLNKYTIKLTQKTGNVENATKKTETKTAQPEKGT